MRVLVVSPFGTRVNPYIGLFAGGLRTAGADVDVTRVLDLSTLVSAARPDVIHLHWIERYDLPPALQPHSHAGLLALVERVALRPANTGALYSLRHWQRLHALLDGLAVFRKLGGRVAYTVHNLDPHEAGSWVERRAQQEMIRTADVLQVHDSSTASEIFRRYGRSERVTVIPHGHYLDAYPNAISQSDARAQLGLPVDSFVFACLGLMRPYKGLEELLPAFRAAFPADNSLTAKLRLVLAGRPPDAGYVSRLRTLARGDPRIILDPRFIPEDEVQVYLNAADSAVLPYRQITTSGAALLAFSFGLPVVAPAIGAFPHLVTPDRGTLYTSGQLAAALKETREKDWTGARQQILDWVRQFDWGETGRRLLEAYR